MTKHNVLTVANACPQRALMRMLSELLVVVILPIGRRRGFYIDLIGDCTVSGRLLNACTADLRVNESEKTL